MPGFTVTATNHTSFTVSDLDRAIAFFRDGLGFQVTDKLARPRAMSEQITGVAGAELVVVFAQAPGHRVELIEYVSPRHKGRIDGRPCDAGFAHIAFNVDDLDAAIASAARHDVRPVNPPVVVPDGPHRGARAVYLRDRDGITIELIELPRA